MPPRSLQPPTQNRLYSRYVAAGLISTQTVPPRDLRPICAPRAARPWRRGAPGVLHREGRDTCRRTRPGAPLFSRRLRRCWAKSRRGGLAKSTRRTSTTTKTYTPTHEATNTAMCTTAPTVKTRTDAHEHHGTNSLKLPNLTRGARCPWSPETVARRSPEPQSAQRRQLRTVGVKIRASAARDDRAPALLAPARTAPKPGAARTRCLLGLAEACRGCRVRSEGCSGAARVGQERGIVEPFGAQGLCRHATRMQT